MADGFMKLIRYDKELHNLFINVVNNQFVKYKFKSHLPLYIAELKFGNKIHKKGK